jgi:hypothetical protein
VKEPLDYARSSSVAALMEFIFDYRVPHPSLDSHAFHGMRAICTMRCWKRTISLEMTTRL